VTACEFAASTARQASPSDGKQPKYTPLPLTAIQGDFRFLSRII
jgi:hypothetical protein